MTDPKIRSVDEMQREVDKLKAMNESDKLERKAMSKVISDRKKQIDIMEQQIRDNNQFTMFGEEGFEI